MISEKMTSQRPYLLRAFYDWIVDNDLTPYIVVNATIPGVMVPMDLVKEGKIVLNIAPVAVGNLQLNLDAVLFNARFGGRPENIYVPISAIQAIYAQENGVGTLFPEEEMDEKTTEDGTPKPPTPPKGRPSLKLIK